MATHATGSADRAPDVFARIMTDARDLGQVSTPSLPPGGGRELWFSFG